MIDLLIVLAFVVYSISSGLRARKKASKNLQEYFLAGKTIKGWRAGFSMAATQFAADTPLLVTGLIATAGIFLVWRLWIYGIAFLMMGYILAQGWRRANVLTDAELTEVRYSGKGVLSLRVLKAIYYGTVINCVGMAVVLVAGMRIAEIFLPWQQWLPEGFFNIFVGIVKGLGISLGSNSNAFAPDINSANNLISILAILGFTALYSTTGGLRSVVATDVMQFGLAMIGTLVYAVIIVFKVGGLGNLTDRVVELYGSDIAGKLLSFSPTAGELLMPFLVLIGLQWFFQMNSDGTGYLAQRSMGCASDRDARIAAIIFAWMQILVRSLFWLIIGVGLLVIYPFSVEAMAGEQFAASREITFVKGIEDLLPVGIRGLMLTGLLAALASTLDTHLNWGASYWSNDIYQGLICKTWRKREPQNRELVIVARLSNILILTTALIIMANLGSIQKAWFISLLFGAGMGSVLVLRWLWERINLFSEVAAMVVSLMLGIYFVFFTELNEAQEWFRLLIMALVSTTAAISVTFITPPTDIEVLKRFYQKVKPLGFWRKTAAAVGEDPKRSTNEFLKGAKSTIFTSLSLFFLLVGFGKLLIRLPDQSIVWPFVFLILGLSLVPLWWRAALSEDGESVVAKKE